MFTIRQHQDDKDMLEIITRTGTTHERIMVWSVVHEDFLAVVISDENTRKEVCGRIANGEELEFNDLVIA